MAALLALVSLAAVFGAVLGFAAVRFKTEGNPIADQINDILPQTQCGQCGFPGCRPYAEAIANGEAINKCPPGGEAGIQALADLLDLEPIPLDAEHGEESITRGGLYPRGRVHRLHQVYPGLPGRRHPRGREANAHGHHQRVHRLRPVRGTLPGRLYRHDPARKSHCKAGTGNYPTRWAASVDIIAT